MTEDGLSPDTLAALDALVTEPEAPSEAEHEVETSDPADETEKPETETEADPEGDKPEGEDEAKDEDEDEPEEPKKKKLSGSERLKRRIAALEAELAERRPVQTTDGDALTKAVESEIGAPPKESDFAGDYLAYERALTAYETEKRIVTRDVKRQLATQQARAREAQYETIEEHRERLDDLEKALPGSKAKLAQAAKSGVNPDDRVARLILSSEKSAHLAVHLADKPELVAELNALSRSDPERLGFKLGNIAARLSLPKPKTATKAPPPVQPVKGSARASFNPDKASVGDLAKHLGIRG